MRNNILNHLLQIANVSFIFGIVLTTILVSQSENIEFNWPVLYIPCIIFLIISLGIATAFAIFKKNYFILVGMHISKKSITLYKWSVYMLFINIFIAIVMLFLGSFLLLVNSSTKSVDFFRNGYLYIVIALEMVLTLIDVAIDALSKLKTKVDLSIKRGGSDLLLSKDYANEKLESESNSITKN
ncbi:MAG: hypothetical protein K2J02_00470 [Malacoplasma sp.]|nr:hypothetical protein [Malacoplasma sp.]MDE5952872.1 hypothetical protein [Malacoplasma sp.]MDE6893834.1 hypothetical protein [Malacoplasma sp.]MDE7075032.1 hypothetical protein [Malacoplasma sp.]